MTLTAIFVVMSRRFLLQGGVAGSEEKDRNMNIVDMLIIAVVCVCMIRGIFRGLSNELASIVGIIAGFYGAYLFYPQLAALFPEAVPDGVVSDIVAFTIIFSLTLLVVNLLGKLIRFALGIVLLGWMDRLLGAGFGAAKGTLIAAVAIFVLTSFYQPSIKAVNQSILGGYVTVASDLMVQGVSSRWHQELKTRIMEFRNNWIHRSS